MKPNPFSIRPAAALLIGAAAILSTPLLAQEVPAPANPPPTEQATTPAPITPAPEAAAPADSAPPPVVATMPPAPVAVAPTLAPPVAAPAPIARASTARTKATTATRAVTRRVETATPAEAAPAASVPAATTTEFTPAPAPLPAAQQTITTPTAPAPAATVTTQTTTRSPLWAWIAGAAIVILAGLGAAIAFGRRRTAVSDEPREELSPLERARILVDVPSEAAFAAPIAAVAAVPDTLVETHAPAEVEADAHERVSQHESDANDLAGITDTAAPVARRPWLEFGVRPIRAGTSFTEALVELELIVGNSGDTAAEDVRISTFMLPVGAETEMDRMLAHPHTQSVESMTIEPGKGTTVDATLSVSREMLNGDVVFEPVVVAEARYTMADGSEGVTAAAFRLGLTDEKGEHFRPIGIERPEIFHNVSAQLHGTPEHV